MVSSLHSNTVNPAATEIRLAAASASTTTLIELPFYSTMPDTSLNRRFCDDRKTDFIRRQHSYEAACRQRRPPLKDTFTTLPARDFCFQDSAPPDLEPRQPHVLCKTAVQGVPFREGKGAQPATLGIARRVGRGGCEVRATSEIFPRFDFNRDSSALASSVYGAGTAEPSHVPLKSWNTRGTALEELMAAAETDVASDDRRLKELAATIDANNSDRVLRKHAQNLLLRHRSSSKQIRGLIEHF